MSPGNIMQRVYGTLKARLLSGEFQPGERLDPGRLAIGLSASRTPVRDALHQLSGERLVDNWEQEGFRAPHIHEPAIRDLYEWTNEVLHTVIRAGSREANNLTHCGAPIDPAYVQASMDCFAAIASCSANYEHRAIVAHLNDRSALLRKAEMIALNDAAGDLLAIEMARAARNWTDVGRAVDHFHRRRIRLVAEIASVLRPREPL